jgi:monoglucosyldiacylglycerol epimerase
VEFHGDMGLDELKDYSASKRAFALRARDYYRSDALIYRHIVPSSFTSAMGKGAMSAGMAVNIALFLIRRGFRYVPVTLTGLAVLNYFRFRFFQKGQPDDLQPAE